MFRLTWLTGVVLVASATIHGSEPAVDLTRLDRTIRKEPAYHAVPRYALLVIGPRAEYRAWLVVDGDDVAYVDRNGDGDLTEPGERVDLDREATDRIKLGGSDAYKAMHVFPLGEVAGTKLNFQLWVPNPGYDASTDEPLGDRPEVRAYIRDMRNRNWLNGSLHRIAADGMWAQIPLALTTKPFDAQVCHLLGPLTFQLKWGARQRLETWPKRTVFDLHIGSRNLPPRGWTRSGFDFSPLTTSEVPEQLHPVATFEFPGAGPDGKPLREEVVLDQRCCGDTHYATFTIPKGATSGAANVTVTLPPWVGHSVERAQFEVPINQGLSRTGEAAYVMFHDPQIRLKDAVNVLRKHKLDVTIREDALLILDEEHRFIGVRLNRDPEAHAIARALADGTEFAEHLSRCDARFEIGPYEADKAETIRRIEQLLQELTRGLVYQTWDQQLSGPR